MRSQAGQGWVLLPEQYDDGGYTGANMDRPTLRRLLADVRDRKIDCILCLGHAAVQAPSAD
ncbi:MAG: recombinase family protein [Bdellovibrionales bacterium]|nr:recombinase family protein [Bdellovibrionales bacterium]